MARDSIEKLSRFSRSQLHRWRRGEQLERKARDRKVVPQATVEAAAQVIAQFPHFGGRKGQAYMLYHELGYIGMRAYDRIRHNVKRLLAQAVSQRGLLPEREFYEHVRAEKAGEIWAEDFTEVTVEGSTFKAALVLDTYDTHYLGSAADGRATAALVGRPVEQALEKTGGKGPEKFLLSDNGSQYISDAHARLLTSAEIVQRRIPACVPQYNGCVEGGMRELKSVFYNVWEKRVRERADEEKSLLERVEAALSETVRLMNEEIPRASAWGRDACGCSPWEWRGQAAADPGLSSQGVIARRDSAVDSELLEGPQVSRERGADEPRRAADQAGFFLPSAPADHCATQPRAGGRPACSCTAEMLNMAPRARAAIADQSDGR